MTNEQMTNHEDASTPTAVGLYSGADDGGPRRHGWLRKRSMGHHVGVWCVVLCLVALLVPSPFVVESAGPTQDVLGKADGKPVIAISGVRQHASRGKLLLLTVNAEGVPGFETPVARVVPALFDSRQEVLPSEAVFTPGQSAEQYSKESAKQMSQSQDSSAVAALAFARKHGIDVANAKVNMHVDDIGGPSAGMMYSLGVISKLTPTDETGGKVIAGTGTMGKTGKVGSIGGIRLKMIGAKRDGATWFLAPRANCDEVVGHVPAGLRDVSVGTLEEAYGALTAIGEGKGAALPHCTVPRHQ